VNDRRLHLYTVYRFLVGKKPLGLWHGVRVENLYLNLHL
jgi:hypothetical protein